MPIIYPNISAQTSSQTLQQVYDVSSPATIELADTKTLTITPALGAYTGIELYPNANSNFEVGDGGGLDIGTIDGGYMNISSSYTLNMSSNDSLAISGYDVTIESWPGDGGSITINSDYDLNLSAITNVNITASQTTITSSLIALSGAFVFPNVTGNERAGLTAITGMVVYQTDLSGSDPEGLYIYKSTGWIQII